MIVVRYAHLHEDAVKDSIVEEAFQSVRKIYRPLSKAVPVTENDSFECQSVVAFLDEALVGTAAVYQEARSLRLAQVAVKPSVQGQGVGRRLIWFLNQVASDAGLEELRLNTILETGNVPIFERLGFSVVGSCPASWCESDCFECLTDIEMVMPCVSVI